MKHRVLTRIVTLGLLATAAMAGSKNSEKQTLEREAAEQVKQSITRFVSYADNKQPDSLVAFLHKDFRVTVFMPGNPELTVMSKQDYVSLLRAGTIGGKPRKLKIESVEINGSFASAKITLLSPELRFSAHYTLVQSQGAWQMLQDAPMVTPL